MTALWLHGLDVEPCNPIQATAPASAGISTRAGMRIRRCQLSNVVKVRGLPTTSIVWTVRELCLRSSLTECVVIADMALHARLTTVTQLMIAANAHDYGVCKLRRVVRHIEPKSESPMETRLRMLLVLAGLPRPEAQVVIPDAGRVDLYYREQRLGLEYDGGTHRVSLVEDNRRQNRLLEAGVRLLRFTAPDIYKTPKAVVRQVRAALAS